MSRTFYILLLLPVWAVFAEDTLEPRDFQHIMAELQSKLDAATHERWTDTLWRFVLPDPEESAPWKQQGSSFPGYDHTGNGIKDDDHLALLQRVLDADPLVVVILGSELVEEIRGAFAVNREQVMAREAWYDFEILDTTRTNLRFSVFSLRNRPTYSNRMRIHTGQSTAMSICVDSGIFVVGTTCFNQNVEIPSLWGEEGMLNEIVPGLAEDFADLLAAYLTIGNQDNVDYLQALMYQAVCRGILPGASGPVASDSNKAQFTIMEASLSRGVRRSWPTGKAYPAPLLPDIDSDTTFSPPSRSCFNDSCSDYMEIIRLVTRLSGSSMQEGIGQYWLNGYTVGANGFGKGYGAILAATGDFSGNGAANVDTYRRAGEDREAWFVAEGIMEPIEGEPPEGEVLAEEGEGPPPEGEGLTEEGEGEPVYEGEVEGEDPPPAEGEPEDGGSKVEDGCNRMGACGEDGQDRDGILHFLGDWLLLGLSFLVIRILSTLLWGRQAVRENFVDLTLR